jgi:hypothetical protein
MKCEVVIAEHPNAWLYLHPETPKEANQLLQLANNAKADGTEVAAFFAGDSIRGEIHLRLLQDRRTSIWNTGRKRK